MDQDKTGQKEQLRQGGNTNSRVEGQDRVRLVQTIDVGRNGGQERMYGVDKMDTEGNSGWKTRNVEGREIWVGVNEGIKIHGFGSAAI